MSNLKTWPEQIYLQLGDCGDDIYPYGEVIYKDNITWCEDSVESTEIKYVRADLIEQVRAEERKRCVQACESAKKDYAPVGWGRGAIHDCIKAIEALKDRE